MESTLALVRGATVLPTYDFVDVVDPAKHIGWQVKATLAGTPMTWKRAKLPDKMARINESRKGERQRQALGNAIIEYCNANARASLDLQIKPEHQRTTGLPRGVQPDDIGIARLILHPDGLVEYYERRLLTRNQPQLFDPASFEWTWTDKKEDRTKEPAFHGIHKASKRKHFAWHGLSENQFHFPGEREWWPDKSQTQNSVRFRLDGGRLSYEELERLLALFDRNAQPQVTSSRLVEDLPLPQDI